MAGIASRRATLLAIGLAAGLSIAGPGLAAQDAMGVDGQKATEAPTEKTAAPAKQPFFRWTDTSLTLLPYGWHYKVDPSEQTTLTVEHAHDSAIGDFFGFLDVNFFHHTAGQEVNAYGEVTPRFSFGKIFQKDLSFAFFQRSLFEFKDVLLAMTYEWGKGPDVPPEAFLLGLGFDLDLRKAGIWGLLGKFQYLQLNVYARDELTETAEHGFRDAQITMVAGDDFAIGPARFLVDGYFDWVLGIGSEVWSYHLNPQIKLDVGHFWGKDKKFYVGVEPDFWWNKFQIPNSDALDTNQQAISLLVKYHF